MSCALCKTRREKRHCPGVQGEICAICCGEQREESISCPLDCEYLQRAHAQEKLEKDPAGMPGREMKISADYVTENIDTILAFQRPIVRAALERNAIDSDVGEALDGLVKTYKTLGSGLYYESRPSNPIAAGIFDEVQAEVAEIRKLEAERGMHKLLDSQILTVLVFMQRLEYAYNNGRKRGRCFLGNLYATIGEIADQLRPAQDSLIIS